MYKKKNQKSKNQSEKISIFGYMKKFWNYIWNDDSLGSYIANFVFAFLVIKFIFFPSIGFVLNNDFPIVAIVSGSMEHKVVKSNSNPYYNICGNNFFDAKSSSSLNIDEYWKYCGTYYEKNFQLSQEKFEQFKYHNGLNIGDVMVLYGKNPENIEIGEVLVFIPQDKQADGSSFFFTHYGPVIHRVVDKSQEDGIIYFQTKGDHNIVSQPNFEQKIPQRDVIGVAVIRIPYIGYVKLWLSQILGLFVK